MEEHLWSLYIGTVKIWKILNIYEVKKVEPNDIKTNINTKSHSNTK